MYVRRSFALGTLAVIAACSSAAKSGSDLGDPGNGSDGATSAGGAGATGGATGGGPTTMIVEGGAGMSSAGGNSSSGGKSSTGGGGASAGGQSSAGGASSAGGGNAFGGSSSVGGGGAGGAATGGAAGAKMGCDMSNPNADNDKDGWTPAQGDCNDCDPQTNPGAYDGVDYVPDSMGNPSTTPQPSAKQVDQDCSGTATQPGDKLSCDDGLAIDTSGDPFAAAKAMELCNTQVAESPSDPKQKKWGVIDAKFSGLYGAFLQTPPANWVDVSKVTGILPNFGQGTKPQGGTSMFSLSSGQARAPGQPGYDTGWACSADSSLGHGTPELDDTGLAQEDPYHMTYPPGFPKKGTCGTTDTPFDGIALDLKIRVPTNAKGMSFQYRFFTCEYPQYTCTVYNDVLAVLMSPYPGGATSTSDDKMWPDVAYDAQKNVIGVNNEEFLTSCKPGAAAKGNYPKCNGTADLVGSGYDNHGASAWLQSNVPVTPGSVIVLRIAIWDSGDSLLDSSAVVDNFQWILETDTATQTPVQTGTTTVTNPIH